MNNVDEINNEEKRLCHHNLRKNRKPRCYDFEYFDESLNRPKSKKRGRKRGRKPKNVLSTIDKTLNENSIDKVRRNCVKRKIKENNICEKDEQEKNKNNEYPFNQNADCITEKEPAPQNARSKGRKRKNLHLDKNVYLFNSNVPLRNNNIKIDKICEYLSYKTNTTWKYMGSTVKFRLINDQQEKYIFLKNMKKHIIFEIIKIAMFALLKVNLNDNNIYTLHCPEGKKHAKENSHGGSNFTNRKITHVKESITGGTADTSNYGMHSITCGRRHSSTYLCKDSELIVGNMNDVDGVGLVDGVDLIDGVDRVGCTHTSRKSYYSYYFYRNSITNVMKHHNGEYNYECNDEKSAKWKHKFEEKKNVNFTSYYDNARIELDRRVEEKNDILNQGVTVSEILDFVKEKYEKYYENVKQYIVTTLNIYCALNIFKLIRRGRYAICRYESFNIFKVKYFKKYYKFFYNLKGEEEILMNVKNYLKSFYYDKTKKELMEAVDMYTGSLQTGDTQTGDTQTGDTQTGDTQTGDTQTGDTQTGDTQMGEMYRGQNGIVLREGRKRAKRKIKKRPPKNVQLVDDKSVIKVEDNGAYNAINNFLQNGEIGKHENGEKDDNNEQCLQNGSLLLFKSEKESKEGSIGDHLTNGVLCHVGKDPGGRKKPSRKPSHRSSHRKTQEHPQRKSQVQRKVHQSSLTQQNDCIMNYCDETVKYVCINLSKVSIKCIKVVYGMKHFFCSYDTVETSDTDFEIIKVQKKYDMLRRSNAVNMNLRYNFLCNSKRLVNDCNVNENNLNDDCHLGSPRNFLLRNNNNVSINKEEHIAKQPQYGKQKRQNNEEDLTKHEKYNYVNFNVSYKTLRKKMICIRHYVSTSKKEERVYKQKHEGKTRDKMLTISNDSLMQTCSINSNLSNVVSVDGLSNLKCDVLVIMLDGNNQFRSPSPADEFLCVHKTVSNSLAAKFRSNEKNTVAN
ncbi:conserved Plasmodium protein, unknown function [Plasmodium ovale curtisi]|uniref:Uncharacterized protein n=1 Tax=Plasmodium ovale curtisi TaxID=864141 RepID=A0A1A8W5F3_PLAOA|nr:conserved Plasmodium protein, unknown function [Plasmodium ovale curtisi]